MRILLHGLGEEIRQPLEIVLVHLSNRRGPADRADRLRHSRSALREQLHLFPASRGRKRRNVPGDFLLHGNQTGKFAVLLLAPNLAAVLDVFRDSR